MKKQKIQKLSINRATVSNLNTPEMKEVKGGWLTYTCDHPDFCNTDQNCTTGCRTYPPFCR